MEPAEFFDPIILSQTPDPAAPWTALNVAAVYQDTLTRDWVLQACDCTTQRLRPAGLRSNWWRMDFLRHPQIFDAAVQAACEADVIFVSVYAAESVPSQVVQWCEEWLARRRLKEGALVALVGTAPPPGPPLAATLDYWRRAAERGGLDFLPYEKRLAGQRAVGAAAPLALPAHASYPHPPDGFRYNDESHYHFGLNE